MSSAFKLGSPSAGAAAPPTARWVIPLAMRSVVAVSDRPQTARPRIIPISVSLRPSNQVANIEPSQSDAAQVRITQVMAPPDRPRATEVGSCGLIAEKPTAKPNAYSKAATPVATSQPAHTAPQRMTGCSWLTLTLSDIAMTVSPWTASCATAQQRHDDQDGNGDTQQPSQHIAKCAFLGIGVAAAAKCMGEPFHRPPPC